MTPQIGSIGVWSSGLRLGDPDAAREAVGELEVLGYDTVWIPGAAFAGTIPSMEPLLQATERLTFATGIVNIWVEPADDVAVEAARVADESPGRLLLGVGISHAPLIGERYRKPLSAMTAYLDELDAAGPAVASDQRIIAALGPKMLEVARERSVGSHPYLMPPEHTAIARDALGPGKLLAPEQTVVLESDPAAAREAARGFLATYLGLPNYTNNLRRVLGFDDADFADGGSDRLVDATVAWGDEDAIRRRVDEHFAAGADHVCIQVVAGSFDAIAIDGWRRLAPVLCGT